MATYYNIILSIKPSQNNKEMHSSYCRKKAQEIYENMRQAAKISHINLRQTQILWCTALTVSAAAADLHVETERIRPWWDRVQLHLYGTAKVESTVQRAANPNQFPKVPPNHHNGISDSRHKGATIIKWHKNGVHADYLKIIVIQCTGCHFYWQHNGKKMYSDRMSPLSLNRWPCDYCFHNLAHTHAHLSPSPSLFDVNTGTLPRCNDSQ